MTRLDILCTCSKCGREFVSLPQQWPFYDQYPPQFPQRFPDQMVCMGKLELTDAGKAVECGILSFEAVFMPYMLLENGETLIDRISALKLLPAPQSEA